VENAKVKVQLPSWLKAADAFEMTSEGTRELPWKTEAEAVTIDLATVNVTRLVFITSDTKLRQKTQRLYDDRFAANVRTLMSK